MIQVGKLLRRRALGTWKVLFRWQAPQRIPARPPWSERGRTRASNQAEATMSPSATPAPEVLGFLPECGQAKAGREESETGTIQALPTAAPKALNQRLTERQAHSQCSVIPTRVLRIWLFLSSAFILFCSGGLREVCRGKSSRLFFQLCSRS